MNLFRHIAPRSTFAWIGIFFLLTSMPIRSLKAARSMLGPPTTTGIAGISVSEDAANGTVDLFAAFDDLEDPDTALSFQIFSNSNPGLFASTSIDGATGFLTLDYAPDANGVSDITIRATDTEGLFVDASFTVTVSAVNDPPSFVKGQNQTVNEDAALQTVNGWATNISAGPANEASQTLTFDVSNNNTALFATQPAISSTGTLTYRPAPNTSGSATVSVTLRDNGGTLDGGVNSSTAQTFTITVNNLNDPPTTTGIANVQDLEDAPNRTIDLFGAFEDPEDADNQLTFTVTANSNPALFAAPPAINGTAGTLTLNYAPNANGSSSLTVRATDTGGLSVDASFTVNLTAVNDPPSFVKGQNQTVNEDAALQTVNGWATNISAGPANEASQTLTFDVSNNNTSLFSTQPAISNTGTLTYRPAPNTSGSATVSVTLRDNGGTLDGGINSSTAQTFTITVNGINDPPTTTGIANVQDLEDAPNRTINLFSAFDDAEDADNQLTFTVTANSNPALFAAPPAVNGTAGTLTLNYAPNANGASSLTVRATDTGGLSVDASFSVNLTAVNDPPSFVKGQNQTVNEDAALQTVNGWATNISAGPANEASQTLTFDVSNNNTALFATQPAISSTGTLTYRPAPNRSGSATVSVTLRDNGGTANGGNDASPTQTFTITVNGINDPPTTTGIANVQDLEDAPNRTIDLFGAFEDPEDADNQLTFTVTANSNPALFAAPPAVNGTAGTLTLNYAPNANGASSLTVRATDTGGLSVDASFSVNLTAVNDPPSFVKGQNVTINEDAPSQNISSWATGISKGPANEASQSISFQVSNDNNGLFSAQPAISPAGALSFTPAPNMNGSAVVTVSLQDNGGTANGGNDTSPSQTFTIAVNGVNDPPVAVDDAYVLEEGQSLIASAGGSPPGVLDNDTDLDGDNLTATVVQAPLYASTWSFNTNGSFVYVHDGSENLNDTITYIANDGTTNSNVATVRISIRQTNDSPIANKIEDVTVLEDAPNTVISLFNAFDDPDDPDNTLAFSVQGNTNAALFNAVTIDPPTGNLSLDYRANANGVATVTVQAMDSGGLTAQTSFKVTVNAVNDPPSMIPGNNIALDEDPGAQNFPNWATQISPGPPDEATQTITVGVSNSNPTLFSSQPAFAIAGTTGTLTFTPAPETSGQATVTITLSDNGGIQGGGVNTASYEFLITISGNNDPPTSSGIADIQPLEDAANVTYNLFNIFDDVEDPDENLVFSLPSGFDETMFSAVTIAGTPPILTLDFAADAWGSSTITVRATDTGGLWVDEKFTVDIQPINDAPGFTPGSDIALPQNSPSQNIQNWASNISAGAQNESGQTLHFTVTNDNEALFGQQPAIDPDGDLTFAPAIGDQVFGKAEVTVILSDNGGTENGGVDRSDAVTFTIDIRRFNTPPTANNDNYLVDQGGSLTVSAAIGVLANDSDAEDDPLVVRLISGPDHASAFTLNANGSFTYRHDNSATTSDAFTYVTNDGFEDSNVATATISVQSLGSLVLQEIRALEDAPDVIVDVRTAMSISEAGYTFTLASVSNEPLFDVAEIDSLTGFLTLSFAANQSGSASLAIAATPFDGDIITATQPVTILPVNDAPIAVGDAAATIANRPVEIDVLSNDVDYDGDALTIRTFTNPDVGSVEPQFNGRFLYTPIQDFTGQASFSYTISDDSLATDIGKVTITIFSGRFVATDLLSAGVTSAAYNISNVGEAVGVVRTSDGGLKAFSSSQDVIEDAPSEALDANDFGQIVGAMAAPLPDGPGLTFLATRWDTTGALVLGAFDGRSSKAYGINNEGQIVGASTGQPSEFLHAFLWQNGDLAPLESESTVESQAFTINEQGQSAGYSGGSAIIWNGDRIQRRLTGAEGRAYGLNDRGQAVGSIDDGSVRAVYWEDNGTLRSIDGGSDFSEAYGINNASWIVGAYRTSAGKTASPSPLRRADALAGALRSEASNPTNRPADAMEKGPAHASLNSVDDNLRAFLWQGDTIIDLNDLIDAESGWILLEARAINNAAQIIGVGTYDGQPRAFLLSPTNNKTPTATNDVVRLPFIAPLTFDVLGNDTDEDGDTLRVVAVTQGQTGSVELLGSGRLTYTPSAGFGGRDAFTYTIDDGRKGRATAEVVIQIDEDALPASYRLDQNYPNPFNPTTTIVFGLPEKTHIRLDIFNMLGQRVQTLIDDTRPAGVHAVEFDAGGLPGGAYMYRLNAGRFSESRKMILLK